MLNKILSITIFATILLSQRSYAEETKLITFNREEVGKLPAGFVQVSGRWLVKEIDGAKRVLMQTGEPRDTSEFNIMVLDNPIRTDIKLTVRFKSISGKMDQGGGLVWRFMDRNNYYIARFNPLEDNLRVHKVESCVT